MSLVPLLALFLSLSNPVQASAPTLEKIEALTLKLQSQATKEHRILALEEVLEAVGKKYPLLRQNYILMHESQSKQQASYEFPRVISYMPDARFVLAFNGDPQARGFYEIEMMEFSRDNKALLSSSESFKFRRISFKPPREYPYYRETHKIKNFPAIHPVNESTCQGCHTTTPRPNWESYALWEGSYFKTDRPSIGEKYALPYQSPEHAGFDVFYTQQANKGRYRFLQGLEARFVVPVKALGISPPSQFTQLAGYFNFRRVVELMRKTAQFETYQYATLAALYDCENFESFLPKKVRDSFDKPLAYYISDTKRIFDLDANHYFLSYEESKMGKWRYLYEGRGYSMRDWSMSFRRGPYTFVTPVGSVDGFVSSLLIEQNPALEAYRVYTIQPDSQYTLRTEFVERWTGSMKDMTRKACGLLKTASCQAFQKLQMPCE